MATADPLATKRPNVLGLIALIGATLGLILSCIPAVLAIGWLLLVVSFVLAIVSLFLRRRKRGLGVAAVIVSVVGAVVAFLLLFVYVVGVFAAV